MRPTECQGVVWQQFNLKPSVSVVRDLNHILLQYSGSIAMNAWLGVSMSAWTGQPTTRLARRLHQHQTLVRLIGFRATDAGYPRRSGATKSKHVISMWLASVIDKGSWNSIQIENQTSLLRAANRWISLIVEALLNYPLYLEMNRYL
jgi:hypothetical protein